MIEFSATLAAEGLPVTVTSQQDVDSLTNAFHEHVKTLNLWQYYVLGIEGEKESVKAALSSPRTIIKWNGPDVAGKPVSELAEILKSSKKVVGLGQLASRFGVKVEGGVAAGFVQAAFVDLSDVNALAAAWVRVVDVVNVPLYAEWENDTKVAIESVKNRLKYTRLDEHGPKLGAISKA